MSFTVLYSWVRLRLEMTPKSIKLLLPGYGGMHRTLLQYQNPVIKFPNYLHFVSKTFGYMLVLESVNGKYWTCPSGYLLPD